MASQQEIILAGAVALAVSAAVCRALYGTFSPTSRFWGPVLSKSPEASRPWVSLTFDDGPTPGCTDRVLDLLAELKVPATFFVIGRNAEKSPELVRRMYDEGHLVANHTLDHTHSGIFRGWRYWRKQLSCTDDIIARLIGRRPAVFRPSMGFTTWPIHHAARSGGHALVNWSLRARDGISNSEKDILRRLLEPAAAGDILMLHDGIDPQLRQPADRTGTISVLRPLIEGLRARRLTPVRLDELLGIAPYADGPAELAGARAPRPSNARTIG